MKKRLDQLLVDQGLVPSRTKAQELIEIGAVEILTGSQWLPAIKASQGIDPKVELRIVDKNLLKYVSRAGLKLENALRDFGINPAGKIALDIGQSTGGFTDCLIQHGAEHVFGVDVAENELHQTLRQHSKVTSLHGVNARDLLSLPEIKNKKITLAVVDVSFISLTKVLEPIYAALSASGELLALIKPQFELSRGELDKKGIVINVELQQKAVENVVGYAKAIGCSATAVKPSQLKGRDGNQEYFLYAKK